jgi:hypothetical protein
MKTFFIFISFSFLLLGCSSKKLVMYSFDNNPPCKIPVYKGQITIVFSKITNIDSLDIVNIS